LKKKIITFLIIVILGVVALVTYKKFYKSDDNSNLTKIKLAEVTHSVFYAPLYVAIEKGYFEEYGIDLELILTSGADKVTAAVLSGDAQIGFSGSEATIYVYNGGEKDYLKTFAQLTQKDGSFLVSREKIENFTLENLKGKSVVGGRKGGMPEMTFEWVLKQHNIDPLSDLTIDTSIAFAAMSGAFIGGQGDFVTLFEPQATQVEQQGFGYVVASIGELGGVVPYTSYSAKISYIEKNPEIIDKFTRAIQKGLDFVHQNDSATIADVILTQFPDTSKNDLIKVIDRYKGMDAWPKNTNFSKESFDHLQSIMIDANELEKKVDFKDLIYVKD